MSTSPSWEPQHFITTCFLPSLAPLGLRPEQSSLVAGDVQTRLHATLHHWHTPAIRDPLLELARELAAFYEPLEASWDARLLVATAVRNSLLEELSAAYPVNPVLRMANPNQLDDVMPMITGEAIRYFAALPLDDLARELPPPPADPFAHLPTLYPRAWHTLTVLARMSGTKERISLPSAPPITIPASGSAGRVKEGSKETRILVVESGFDPGFDTSLVRLLTLMQEGRVRSFYVDSFKELSRLPDKVLHVIEITLGLGVPFATMNYYIAPTSVARRADLIRPAHFERETAEKLTRHTTGASQRHTQALRAAHQGFAPETLTPAEFERRLKTRGTGSL